MPVTRRRRVGDLFLPLIARAVACQDSRRMLGRWRLGLMSIMYQDPTMLLSRLTAVA